MYKLDDVGASRNLIGGVNFRFSETVEEINQMQDNAIPNNTN